MKLTMKEKKFSIRDSFRVQDENGKDKYQVIGEFIDTGKLYIKDMNGEAGYTKDEVLSGDWWRAQRRNRKGNVSLRCKIPHYWV